MTVRSLVIQLDSSVPSKVVDAVITLTLVLQRQRIPALAKIADDMLQMFDPEYANVRLGDTELVSVDAALARVLQHNQIGSQVSNAAVWALSRCSVTLSVPLACWYLRACWPEHEDGWQQAVRTLNSLILYQSDDENQIRQSLSAVGDLKFLLQSIVTHSSEAWQVAGHRLLRFIREEDLIPPES